MTGTIVQSMHQNEPESEILNRLKQCLRDLRGCSPVGWELILNRKQSTEESFETYAEKMFEQKNIYAVKWKPCVKWKTDRFVNDTDIMLCTVTLLFWLFPSPQFMK